MIETWGLFDYEFLSLTLAAAASAAAAVIA